MGTIDIMKIMAVKKHLVVFIFGFKQASTLALYRKKAYMKVK